MLVFAVCEVGPSPPVVLHSLFVSFLTLVASSLLEARCNNGCPLIIERPRHFKEIPGESPSPGTPFRSLLKISSPFLFSLSLSLSLSLVVLRESLGVDRSFSFASKKKENRVTTKTMSDVIAPRGKLVSPREGTYRTVRPLSLFSLTRHELLYHRCSTSVEARKKNARRARG